MPSRSEEFAARVVLSEGRAAFWRDLVHALNGTDCAAKTAGLLLRRHHRHGGKVYGSQENMAAELLVHPNTISNHTRRLEAAGLLTITRSVPERDPATGEWSRRETNRYWLRFPCKEKAANRRIARRRRKLGVETVIDPAALTPAAEELLASPEAQAIIAAIDGPEPVSRTAPQTVLLTVASSTEGQQCSVVTYTQTDGSEPLTGTKDTGPHEVGVPGVVEKPVSEQGLSPLAVFEAKAAFAAMRAALGKQGR
jgi:hypothetical protein